MKYIRVIDAFEEEYLTTYEEHCERVVELQDSGFDFEGGIIKQANTIEKLCDGLIVEQKDKPNIWFTMEVQEFINEKEHLKDWSYKAFIKTSKGLIYVAKMNDKGEFELL